jgi:hypothetical protein
MDVLIILFIMLVYVLLSVVFVKFVQQRTANQTYRRLAVAFVILLPTWDALLGFVVYYPACLLIPKVAIYETVETDSIYFEGLNNYVFKLGRWDGHETEEELTHIGSVGSILSRGYSFTESKVVEKHTVTPSTKESMSPVIYKCIPLPMDSRRPDYQRTSCSVVSVVNSRYMVKVTTFKVGIAEINFKKIYDRNTGKLMAEFSRATRWSYYGLIWIPFFNWLDWGWGSKEEGSSHCPPSSMDYELFEYKVLKPNR